MAGGAQRALGGGDGDIALGGPRNSWRRDRESPAEAAGVKTPGPEERRAQGAGPLLPRQGILWDFTGGSRAAPTAQ